MTVTLVQSQSQQTIRESIREGAALNGAYMLMNALAATIASYGYLPTARLLSLAP